MVQQCLFRHAVIAAGILRRDVPFISPEDLDIGPWDLKSKVGREQAIECPRRIPTC